jgi:hypothetical protein
MANAYEELRRATQYVRWYHGDALAYAPSLHARTAARRKPGNEVDSLQPEPVASENSPLGGQPPAAQAGLPGANPFANE